MSEIYIPRKILVEDRLLSEQELLSEGAVIVVLAEPGAGKSELLNYLSKILSTVTTRASIFKHRTTLPKSEFLILDGMDEVARTGRSAIDEIIVRASDSGAEKVIFAGRSGEWDNGNTSLVKDSFGNDPIIARLKALDEAEQQQLFQNRFQGEDFKAFADEVERFELSPLLGNPQFLQLLGEAYIQSNHHFTSKAQIFADAVERLAHEANPTLGRQTKRNPNNLIGHSDQVFAKLLLAGSAGVSSVETLNDISFPFIGSLHESASVSSEQILDTRLFKPALDENQHEPVHRIVMEYCAARHLAARVDNQSDRLTIGRVLSVAAPNGVVRDELRGLIGWLAALGNKETQETLIDLDPYAVLANGDPAQLHSRSKHQLIDQLENLAQQDPIFRRNDRWRNFNAGQFFTADLVDKLRQLLTSSSTQITLLELILELLPETEAAHEVCSEIQAIVRNGELSFHTRRAGVRVLLRCADYDICSDISYFLKENSDVSLRLAATVVIDRGVEKSGRNLVLEILRSAKRLFPKKTSVRHRNFDSRYVVGQLIRGFSEEETTYFLDELTNGLHCSCKPKKFSQCDCRIGISKVIGKLLDQYFTVTLAPVSPEQVWTWTRNLYFRSRGHSKRSAAIQSLQEDRELRQQIQRVACANISSSDEVKNIVSTLSYGFGHAGLTFQEEDRVALAQQAFDEKKLYLWIELYTSHNVWSENQRDALRREMRAHANSDPDFMRLWAVQERQTKLWRRKNRNDFSKRYTKRYERREERDRENLRSDLEANRQRIENGSHWGWLKFLSYSYSHDSSTNRHEFYEEELAEKALLNCLPYLRDHVPELSTLSQQSGNDIAIVLNSACVAHFRKYGSLEHIDRNMLVAAKTEAGYYSDFQEGEADAFEAEIDRLLFPSLVEAEAFARAYIEPSLCQDLGSARVVWLDYQKAFQDLRETLPLEWLERFPEMTLATTETLLNMAIKFGERKRVLQLIEERSTSILTLTGCAEGDEAEMKKHRFWQLRAFLYLDPIPEQTWEDFSADPDTIFALERQLGSFAQGEGNSSVSLTAEKVFQILDAYAASWPKVYLPDSWGTGSPKKETAYRFLRDIAWKIEHDLPEKSIPVLVRLIEDPRFADFEESLRNQLTASKRKRALQGFKPPSPKEICGLLDEFQVASVEDLRVLVLEELGNLQKWIAGAETDPIETFYVDTEHVDENTARNRIVDRLDGRMKALSLSVIIERHMADNKRCDFTAETTLSGVRLILPVEVKGQWHPEIFSAAEKQLDERYAIHPNAAGQGIYLALWFGPDEKVAGKKNTTLKSAEDLKDAIVNNMPSSLHPFIDVFVLDLSRF